MVFIPFVLDDGEDSETDSFAPLTNGSGSDHPRGLKTYGTAPNPDSDHCCKSMFVSYL
jgi:hypothetical protein